MSFARPDLIAELATGSEPAWRSFLHDYGRLIYSVPARSALTVDEQEEVFQATCVAIFKSIADLRDPSRLATWVYGIAYRKTMDMHRRRARRRHTDLAVLAEIPDDRPLADEVILQIESAARVHDGLARLDERCRRLISALYLEDPRPGYKEIARRLDTSIGSVGPTRTRCLRKLRSFIETTHAESSQ